MSSAILCRHHHQHQLLRRWLLHSGSWALRLHGVACAPWPGHRSRAGCEGSAVHINPSVHRRKEEIYDKWQLVARHLLGGRRHISISMRAFWDGGRKRWAVSIYLSKMGGKLYAGGGVKPIRKMLFAPAVHCRAAHRRGIRFWRPVAARKLFLAGSNAHHLLIWKSPRRKPDASALVGGI